MISKVIAAGIVLVFALSAGASSGNIAHRKSPNPNPIPFPQFPDFPMKPGLPGFPKNPGWPTIPKIPAPGKSNPKGGPEVPFPLSTTLPFPWANIEGIWRVSTDAGNIFFSFSVQTDTDGHQYLHVLQIDEVTGGIVAEGIGIGVEKEKLVRAAMTAKGSKVNYMLFIGSYRNPAAYGLGTSSPVTVLTVRPFSALMGDHDVQVVVDKVSNMPLDSDEACPPPSNWAF